MRARAFLGVAIVLAAAGCGGTDRQGAVGGAPLLTPAEAQGRNGLVAVQGFFWSRPADGTYRLCDAVLESFPPQCGGPAVDLSPVEVTQIAGVAFSQNVFWADQIRARGVLTDGLLTVETIELNTHDASSGLSFRILLPVELASGNGDFVAVVTNSSAVRVDLTFRNGQSADITLADVETGTIVYRWSDGRAFDEAVREIAVAPAETLRIPLPDSSLSLPAGAYDLVGTLTATPTPGLAVGRAVVR